MEGLSLSGPSFPAEGQPFPCLLSQPSLADTYLLQSVASAWCLAFVGAFGSWRMPLPGPAEEATLSLSLCRNSLILPPLGDLLSAVVFPVCPPSTSQSCALPVCHSTLLKCKLVCGIRDVSDITKPVFGIYTLCVCGFRQPQSQNLQRKLHLYGAKL